MSGLRIAAVAATLTLGAAALHPEAAQLDALGALHGADADAGGKIVANGSAGGAPACASCHQQNGAGSQDAGAPRLAGQSAFYLLKQLDAYADGSRQNEVMEPIAKAMSPAERANAATYYAQAQAQAPYPPSPQADADMLDWGRTLAAVGSQEKNVEGCNNCHGPEGVGVAPSYPALAGQYHDYIKAQLQAWQQGKRTNDPQDVMKYVASKLDDRDIEALAQYFASIQPDGMQTLTGSSDGTGGDLSGR